MERNDREAMLVALGVMFPFVAVIAMFALSARLWSGLLGPIILLGFVAVVALGLRWIGPANDRRP